MSKVLSMNAWFNVGECSKRKPVYCVSNSNGYFTHACVMASGFQRHAPSGRFKTTSFIKSSNTSRRVCDNIKRLQAARSRDQGERRELVQSMTMARRSIPSYRGKCCLWYSGYVISWL